MTLEMRGSCERCGRALAPDGAAYVCTYECTFCPVCAGAMVYACPNCGGELVPRPRRGPAAIQRPDGGPERLRTGRPAADECAAYAAADIARVQGDDAPAALAAQRDTVLALLAPLGDAAVRGVTYAPGKWTLKEVVAHLVDDERIFAYRMLCVARGEARPLPGFDENRYAAASRAEERPWASLLADYGAVRQATLTLLEGLPPEAWRRRGEVNGYEASVRGLAFHVAGHELRHLRAIREKYVPRLRGARAGLPDTRLSAGDHQLSAAS